MTGIIDADRKEIIMAARRGNKAWNAMVHHARARRVRQLQAEFEADWLARILPGTRLRLTTSHAAIVAGGAV